MDICPKNTESNLVVKEFHPGSFRMEQGSYRLKQEHTKNSTGAGQTYVVPARYGHVARKTDVSASQTAAKESQT